MIEWTKHNCNWYSRPVVLCTQCSLFSRDHCCWREVETRWPHNPATGFRPPSATVVSAEPFSHWTRTLRCLQKEMATYRHWSVSLRRDPDDVSHCRILSPDKTKWRLISATLCGWRRCFVADQLWLIKRIREEKEKVFTCHQYSVLFFATHWKFKTSNAIDLRPQLIKLNKKID